VECLRDFLWQLPGADAHARPPRRHPQRRLDSVLPTTYTIPGNWWITRARPEAVEAIAKNRVGRAPPPGPGVPALGYGLTYGVTCREDYPFATPEDLAAAGREAFPDYPASVQSEGIGGWAYANEDCRDVWKVPAAPTAMRQPVTSTIPTLLISGSFDTLTSLAGANADDSCVRQICCGGGKNEDDGANGLNPSLSACGVGRAADDCAHR
jgi:hypothetical protein